MNPPKTSVWLHRLAWVTAALTLLLPVTTGAVVTTLKAGMVFADWPSSDGHFMLTYPWLSSARDEFIEHGHRLAGMVIGLLSMSLAIVTWCLDGRRTVRGIATAIFCSVFAQGMLGGARVLLSEQLLAFLHGDFAAIVFSLMCLMVLMTSNGWESRQRMISVEDHHSLTASANLLLVSLIAQYVLGGFLRHLRERSAFAWAWMVHPWFALIVLFAAIMFFVYSQGSESSLVGRCGVALAMLAVTQSLIGLATWYVRYGVPEWGIVAQQDSMPQILICSLHKIVGMSTLMTGVLASFCCWSVRPIHTVEQSDLTVNSSIAGAVV